MNPSYKAITEAYTQYLQTLGFADTTCYDFPRFVSEFLEYAEQRAICQIDHITTKTVWSYFSYLERAKGKRTKQTFSSSHLNRIFLAIDKFFEFLHQNGLESAPLPLRYQVEHTRKKTLQVLTRKEVQSLYDAVPLAYANARMNFATREIRQMAAKLTLDLCYGCGLRRAEALNVKVSDIDFDKRIIHVRQGKNYKDRFVPMSQKVYEGVQTFAYQYRRCFNQIKQRVGYLYPFSSGALVEALEILVEKSNDEGLKEKNPSLHTLRHSIATHLLQNGMTIENISRFLGHSSLVSTQIYTHIVNEYGNEL